MLDIRHVDDQSYESIVKNAKARLPWLCPAWTDHNAHDPGITVLELMAWYKELQQFYMDRTTGAIRRSMLELVDCAPLRARAAECVTELPPDNAGRTVLSRLTNAQGMEFELLESVPEKRAVLDRTTVRSRKTGREFNVDALIEGGVSYCPFRFGGVPDTELRLGFSSVTERELRLWCEIPDDGGVKRNRPAADSLLPRTLVWEAEGCGRIKPVFDETWALSWSGYVCLPVPEKWKPGKDGLYWLRLRETEPGCEGEARLSGVYAGRFRCAQQRTRAKSYSFRIAAAPAQTVKVVSAQAEGAAAQLFLRRGEGWERVKDFSDDPDGAARSFTLDGGGSAQDGEDNLLIVCRDSACVGRLAFESHALPEESFFLDLGGQTATKISLICPTLCADGAVRPELWHRVDDLASAKPGERVFVLDARRERIRFGDGRNGGIPARGEVTVSDLVVSRCASGNVPQDAGLFFESDGVPVSNSPAYGGTDPETPEQAGARLRLRLSDTPKCETAEDYERCARKTPGLRVACAKALPGYDANQNGVRRRSACVCVVVFPQSDEERPMPDRRFLNAVDRQLEGFRQICIHTRAIAPRYISISLSAQIFAEPLADEEKLREAIKRAFRPCAELVGRTIRRDELIAKLQKLPGVLEVRRLELRGRDQNSYQTAAGDLDILPNGIPVPEDIELVLTDTLK
ncbi:MAG: baseplate J/gp47 family protein [Oscillospiraceae bacterium]|nr:baseplate J/gp47 family protein [Oscillospiraceae bacterium]